jgi:hypothetical protein
LKMHGTTNHKVVGCHEHINKPLAAIKYKNFLTR